MILFVITLDQENMYIETMLMTCLRSVFVSINHSFFPQEVLGAASQEEAEGSPPG